MSIYPRVLRSPALMHSEHWLGALTELLLV